MKLTYLTLGIYLSALCLAVCVGLLVADMVWDQPKFVPIEEQCHHMNKWSQIGEYGPCPNDPGLAVYRRAE